VNPNIIEIFYVDVNFTYFKNGGNRLVLNPNLLHYSNNSYYFYINHGLLEIEYFLLNIIYIYIYVFIYIF